MGFENYNNLTEEFIAKENFDIKESLENPESIFEGLEAPSDLVEEALSVYEKILTDNDKFLGSGNAGIVFKESEKACFKCVWEALDVEIKNKRFDLLPQKEQKLRKVYDYFEEIKQKKRKLVLSGYSFESDNQPLKEAGFQEIAKRILDEKGMGDMIPGILGVVELESEDEGEINDLPYYTREKVYLISMETVDGINIEDLILKHPENSDILEKINFDSFEQKIFSALKELHGAGLSHKDLSLRNIMINRSTGEPKIIDFGKSKLVTIDSPECESDNNSAKNVLNHLKSFLNDPKKKKENLISGFEKFEQKF